MSVLLGVLVFVIAVCLDYADTLHKLAIERRDGHRAGCYSVLMYWLGLVGLSSVLNVSMWFIMPESIGLYIGSRIAMHRARSSAVSSAKLHEQKRVSDC